MPLVYAYQVRLRSPGERNHTPCVNGTPLTRPIPFAFAQGLKDNKPPTCVVELVPGHFVPRQRVRPLLARLRVGFVWVCDSKLRPYLPAGYVWDIG